MSDIFKIDFEKVIRQVFNIDESEEIDTSLYPLDKFDYSDLLKVREIVDEMFEDYEKEKAAQMNIELEFKQNYLFLSSIYKEGVIPEGLTKLQVVVLALNDWIILIERRLHPLPSKSLLIQRDGILEEYLGFKPTYQNLMNFIYNYEK